MAIKAKRDSDPNSSGSSNDAITSTEGLLNIKCEKNQIGISDTSDLELQAVNQERQEWGRKAEFILAVVGFAVGLGNVWRFPYLCYKNGGGAFFIPYLLMCFLGGIPVFFLELSLGQFMKQGGIACWDLVPLFRGVGVASAVCVFFCNCYYIMVLAWAIFYMIESFKAFNGSGLPWLGCDNWWSSGKDCYIPETTNYTTECHPYVNFTETINGRQTPVATYWENRVLGVTDDIHTQGQMRWEILGCLAIAWILVWLIVCRGPKSSGKAAWVTALYPYFVLTALLIRAVTLPGAMEGIKFYLKPDFSRLAYTEVWIDAGTQIFFSYAIGLGALTALGSYNKYDNNCYRDAIILSFVNSFTSFFAGFAVFAFLGFMSCESGIDIKHVATSGPGLAFQVYPKGLTMMPHSPFWAVAFFSMLLNLGIGSQFVGMESFLTAVSDLIPALQKHRAKFSLFVTFICFSVGSAFCMEGGFHTFKIFDRFGASGFALLWLSFWESIAIGWGYGGDKYLRDIGRMCQTKCHPYFKYCFQYFTPIITMTIFWASAISYSPMKYENNNPYPLWGELFGWCLALTSMLCVPGIAIFLILREKGTIRERIQILLTPKFPAHVYR